MLLFKFSCKELGIAFINYWSQLPSVMKNKQIDHIRNIMFITAFLQSFFHMQEKLKTCSKNKLKFEFETFYKAIFWRLYTCNLFIMTTSAPDFEQLFYKFYPIKQTFLSKRIQQNCSLTFNYSNQTQ